MKGLLSRHASEEELVEYIKNLDGVRASSYEIKWYVVGNKNIAEKRKHEIIHEKFSEWCSENGIRWY